MADAVTSQTILDSSDRLIIKLTNISDGTGESAVKKVDISTYTGMASTSRCSLERLVFTMDGMAARLLWDADTDVIAWSLPQNGSGDVTFNPPLINNSGTGITGDINLTTVGHTSGDSYSVVLYLRKQA